MVSHGTTQNMIEHSKCPVCESDRIEKYLTVESYRIRKNFFDVYHCDNCTHQFTNPIPELEDVLKYYQSENYISHTNSKKSLFDKAYSFARNRALNSKLRIIEDRCDGRRILDYGCGTGAFLNHMYNNSWDVAGIEPSADARENADGNIRSKIEGPETLDTFMKGEFNAITLWHVFEHLYDPKEMLLKFNNALDNEGRLFIAIPNAESLDAKLYKEHWAAYDVPLHVSHFTKKSFKKVIQGSGFELEEIINMPYDAYYISMISEKNKSGRNNYPRSIINGYRSNRKGWKDINASSLIYILKKTQ